MWTNSISLHVLLIIQFLVIFQISFGKPTTEEPFNHSTTTTEPVHIDVREDGVANSSFLETVSVLLTVLSPNDSATAEEDDSSASSLNNTANSTTTATTLEPEYYDDHNSTTSSSSTLNELEEAVEDDDGDLSMLASVHLGSSTESSSSLLSSLITEEMEVADSFDESVTATMLTLIGDGNDDVSGADDVVGGSGAKDDDDAPSRTGNDDGNIPSRRESGSHKDTPSSTDDSIIIASLGSNLNVDTVEPLTSHAINADAPTEEEIISSSRLLYDIGSSSSSAPEPTIYSVTDANKYE